MTPIPGASSKTPVWQVDAERGPSTHHSITASAMVSTRAYCGGLRPSRSDGLGCPWGALMHVTLKVVLETALRVRDVRSRLPGQQQCTTEPSPRSRPVRNGYKAILKRSSKPL